jgi:hypothetical protein
MRVEVTYGEQDTKEIIMAAHVAAFGNPPEGYKWVIVANGTYTWSGFTVVSERIEPTEPEVEVANG